MVRVPRSSSPAPCMGGMWGMCVCTYLPTHLPTYLYGSPQPSRTAARRTHSTRVAARWPAAPTLLAGVGAAARPACSPRRWGCRSPPTSCWSPSCGPAGRSRCSRTTRAAATARTSSRRARGRRRGPPGPPRPPAQQLRRRRCPLCRRRAASRTRTTSSAGGRRRWTGALAGATTGAGAPVGRRVRGAAGAPVAPAADGAGGSGAASSWGGSP